MFKYSASRADFCHAQEKPPLDEQPDKAPLGIELPPEASLKFEAEIVRFTFLLPHAVQLTSSALVCDETMVSKSFLQS